MLGSSGPDALHGAFWEFLLEGEDLLEVDFGGCCGRKEERGKDGEELHCEKPLRRSRLCLRGFRIGTLGEVQLEGYYARW